MGRTPGPPLLPAAANTPASLRVDPLVLPPSRCREPARATVPYLSHAVVSRDRPTLSDAHGEFTLVVDSDGVIAFDGYYWQTDAEELSQYRVVPPIATIPQLLDALAQRRLVLAISRFEDTGDEIRGVWITHDPAGEDAARDVGERLAFRYWDGAPYRID